MTDYRTDLTLNTGAGIPRLGFGTWQIADDEVTDLVAAALDAGYRHIDTAAGYDNEAGVGRALAGVPRERVFVTTKLRNQDQGRLSALDAFDRSLDLLGLEQVDLYLIHWPLQDDERLVRTWESLQEVHATGRARAIGVSNFEPKHLDLLAERTDIVPATNQIELHPGFTQDALRDLHAERGIVTTSWSPLGGTSDSGWGPSSRPNTLLDDPTVARIAAEHDASPAQVIIRWHLENDLVVIPKSRSVERIRQNADVFDFALTDAQRAEIGALSTIGRVGADPNVANFGDPGPDAR